MTRINIEPREPVVRHYHPLEVWHWPVWGLAFRPFFLGAAAFSVISLAVWQLWLSGNMQWHGLWAPSLWHAHEMLFGFGASVAVGFLLTAAQTWTGVPGLSGGPLISLFALWLLARVLFWFGSEPELLLMGLISQMLWWLMAIVALGRMLMLSRNQRNYLFIPLLIAMATLNFFLLLPVSGWVDLGLWLPISQHLSHSLVLVFTLLMGIVGGRVIPFFTVNGLKRQDRYRDLKPRPTPRLDSLLIIISVLAVVLFIVAHFYSWLQPGWLMMLLSVLHLWRQQYWHGLKTANEPLLWSLQGAYLLMGMGLMAMGLSLFGLGLMFKDALHLVTIGAIGAMILAMMARVSLGHTGRPLKVHTWVSYGFGLIFVSALVRACLPWFGLSREAWLWSSLFWGLGFSVFVVLYFPILLQRRIDGRLG